MVDHELENLLAEEICKCIARFRDPRTTAFNSDQGVILGFSVDRYLALDLAKRVVVQYE